MTTNIWQERTERFAAVAAKLTQPDWHRRIAGVRARLTPELCPRCLGLGVHLSGCSRIKRALVPALELAAGKAALKGERLMGALKEALCPKVLGGTSGVNEAIAAAVAAAESAIAKARGGK